jgi:hypothetical protein
MAESGGGARWLKYGCFGCLGVVGFVILVAATLSGVAFLKARSEKIEELVLTPELPVPRLPDAPADEPAEPLASAPAAAGVVHLDLSDGGFRIEPGSRGEPVRVEAQYDRTSYELQEALESQDDGSWSYRVGFRRTTSGLINGLKMLFGGSSPQLRVLLPPDVPLKLDVRLRGGGSRIELGGLWLTEVDLDLTQGGYEIDVGDPLRQPLEQMTIRASMGGTELSRLGNASPRTLLVDHSMGGMELDLRGRWLRDSEIEIRSRMGGAVVRLPRDVLIEGLDRGGVRIPEEQELKPPTLSFSVSSDMGEIEFID